MSDAPDFPGEVLIDLPSGTLTASGCTDPELAIDGDTSTKAVFGPPGDREYPWSAPSPAGPIIPGASVSVPFQVIEGDPGPRFLRVEWSPERFVTRVRLRMQGPGSINAGVAFESTLGLIEQDGEPPPPEVPLQYIPLPQDGGIHEIEVTPPLLSGGVVFYPDALLDTEGLTAGDYPSLDLFLLEVLAQEFASEGATEMANPTKKRVRIGVSVVTLYPWNDVTGPYDGTTACSLKGLKTLDGTITSKGATLTGGESVLDLDHFETARETVIKIESAKTDLRTLKLLLGGTFVVDPASGGLGEVQYWKTNVDDEAPYVRCLAVSSRGNGKESFCWPKMKIDGAFGYKLDKDSITIFDMNLRVLLDETYVCQNGDIGSSYEILFGATGETALHS